MQIGILAVQGAFQAHHRHLQALGCEPIFIRSPEQLLEIKGLILPGGESTTMFKTLKNINLWDSLQKFALDHVTWGICAGAILLSRKIINGTDDQESLNVIDVEIERNSYGRQAQSHIIEVQGFDVALIRGPKIVTVGSHVNVMHSYGKDPTWVEDNKTILTTFHPELSAKTPSYWHRHFIQKIKARL